MEFSLDLMSLSGQLISKLITHNDIVNIFYNDW